MDFPKNEQTIFEVKVLEYLRLKVLAMFNFYRK